MLTIDQKLRLLRRAGVVVPAPPPVDGAWSPAGDQQNVCQTVAWEQQVDGLFTQHAVERAVRALEQARVSVQFGAQAACATAGGAPPGDVVPASPLLQLQ
ncbi:hypothetical protein [Variovorax sp. KK3]|uniref:hypothetical protein n=1 Tax=Variovorax sp. KK3 TaxID=1855728 RepID=UPI00097BF114|nr:hypothetical protein [Variovorax sp. KK3]